MKILRLVSLPLFALILVGNKEASLAFLLSSTSLNAARSPSRLLLLAKEPAIIDDDDNNDKCSVSIGFVGCGTIASAVATGLIVAAGGGGSSASSARLRLQSITVTRRSEAKSRALAEKFPSLVRVVDDGENQRVVDAADIIFLTVLPNQTASVLQNLQFDRDRHTLVSLVSTSQLDQLANDSRLPVTRIYKMICLPAVAYGQGVCLLQYHGRGGGGGGNGTTTDETKTLLLQQLLESSLGGVVTADDDRQMSAMMVVSGLMGSFYGILRNNRDWLVRHASGGGLSKSEAEFLVTRIYHGMLQDVEQRRRRNKDNNNDNNNIVLDDLIAEQTPAGLNEQGWANLESLGVLDAYDKVQDAMFRRILGESDGSLTN